MMDLLTDRCSNICGCRLEVSTDLTIEKELFGGCLFESSRLEVEESISPDTMHLARVSTFDIICGDLENRESTHSCALSDEDIGLVDTGVDLSIWSIDTRYSLDTYIRTICRECEEIEVTSDIISLDDRRDLSPRLMGGDHSCPLESDATRHMDGSCIHPIMEWDIRIFDTHTARDRDHRGLDNSPIEDCGISGDMEF